VVVTWGEPIAFDEASDRKAIARELEFTVRRLTTQALRAPPPPRPPAPSILSGALAFRPFRQTR
jgi:hypothetical protein